MAKKKNATASTTTDPNLTLTQLCKAYCEHMEIAGKSPGTRLSYMMELSTAVEELGKETPVATLTAADIDRFNNCDRVMKLHSGKPKAAPSYLKTQRVIRLALAWAAQSGLIEASPIPAKVAKGDAPASEPTVAPAPKKPRKSRALVEVVNEPTPEPTVETPAA